MQGVRSAVVALTVCLPLAACQNPLIKGCEYATGLDKKCNVTNGGRWYEPAPGFVVEELAADREAAAAASVLADETEQHSRGVTSSAARTSADALDEFIMNRYLFTYSDRGTLNDCIVSGQRDSVVSLLSERDGSNSLRFVQLGPSSKLTSRVFESVFASADLKAKLEADLTQALGDATEARAAADVAFSAMQEKLSSDVALGTYRYLVVRSHPQFWALLVEQDLVRAECSDKSVSQGVVVVGLDQRDRLVERTTGVDLQAVLSGVVDAADLPKAVATAQASLSAEIRRQSEEHINVTLDRPAIVPLRWKPDRM